MSARRVRITVDDVELFAAWGDSETADAVFDSLGYIDFFVIGSFDSPQLFER